MQTEENIQRGMDLPDAQAAARSKVGSITYVTEEVCRMNTRTAAAVTVTGQVEPEKVRAIFVTKGVLEALGGDRGQALRRREVLRPAQWT